MEEDKQVPAQTTVAGVVKDKRRFPRIHIQSHRIKLTVLILVSLVLVVGNAVLLFKYYNDRYYVDQKQQPVSKQEAARTQAIDTVQGSYLATRGDQDSKVEYVALLNQGDAEGALALFENKAQAAESDAVRANVYRQLYSTAIVAQRYDHAIKGALGNAQIQPGIEEYEMVVKAYEYAGDKEGQIEYLRKIFDLIDPNVEGLNDIRQDTISRLQALGVEL